MSGYYGAYFQYHIELPKLIKQLMNIIIKAELVWNKDSFQITGVYIDYDLKMVDVKYVK
jgi:hypothetical protein